MKTVLVVSPHFPPADTADMHRVRMSIPYFEKNGWRPIVLTIADRHVSACKDLLLLDSIPEKTVIERVPAVPEILSRMVGIGNATIRAYPFLLSAGFRLIKRHKIDLVYLSTTQFHAFSLGTVWKRWTGVPFILDMQDPWVNCYTTRSGTFPAGIKRRVANWIHRKLERITTPSADGFVSVTKDYVDDVQDRYPELRQIPFTILPFGVSPSDFAVGDRFSRKGQIFDFTNDKVHGVYVGRGGGDMARSLGIIFSALKLGLRRSPNCFSRLRLHFVGTDYAPVAKAVESVLPIARQHGVEDFVSEHTTRIPYFDGLALLQKSDFLLVPGSDDPRYTASKILPYLYASKPLLAVFNVNSPVVSLLEKFRCRGLISFDSTYSDDECAQQLVNVWEQFLLHRVELNEIDRSSLKSFFPENMAKHQCRLFDEVRSRKVPRRPSGEVIA